MKRVLVMGPQWHIAMFRHTHRNVVRYRQPLSWSYSFWSASKLRKSKEDSLHTQNKEITL